VGYSDLSKTERRLTTKPGLRIEHWQMIRSGYEKTIKYNNKYKDNRSGSNPS
jgi:hypothetical protein